MGANPIHVQERDLKNVAATMPYQQAQIIWGGPPPPPTLGALQRRYTAWWDQYQESLQAGPGSDELEATSCRIVEALPDPVNWNDAPTPFKGLVVGAVQSGKTASMIGVAAVALDQGFRVAIVLAGLKDDLRRQTARRFNSQLLQQNDPIEGLPGHTTRAGETGPGPLGGFALNYFFDANHVPTLQVQMERALRRGEPCVIVVKKNPTSLLAVTNALRVISLRIGSDSLPVLVLDDECDEASVAAPGEDRTIPISIASIWQNIQRTPRVAYVGYTATAAASLLQDPGNELFPSHFVQILRYPAPEDGPLTYGISATDSWYTGGSTYYSEFGDEPGEETNFLVTPAVTQADIAVQPTENLSLYEALIAFFVSGAMRLVLQPDRRFDNPTLLPSPHSMIVQTSTSVDDHKRWRDAIRDLFLGEDMGEGTVLFDDGELMQRVADEEGRWKAWHERFEASRRRVYELRPHDAVQVPISWRDVVDKLPTVFRNTNLKAVNSDGGQGQTLDYSPRISASGAPAAPQDVYVIAVGGSKLSRGLTVEGLCISYYTRAPNQPQEDTTLQASRWFGYRGPHLEFCRLFTTEDTYERLKDIQANDFDHRMRLADLMASGASLEQARIALRTSPTCILTAKLGVGSIHNLAFSPSTHLYSRIEIGELAAHNETVATQLVNRMRAKGAVVVSGGSGGSRGVLSSGWSAGEVADALDAFSYTGHNPDPTLYPMPEFYRPADTSRGTGRVLDTGNDPYVAAAYLRYWALQGSTPPPLFNVGVTFGTMIDGNTPFDFSLLNRKVSENGRMEGAWSGASRGWRGDAYFDNPDEELVGFSSRRLEGAEGLLLLHVIHKDAKGRSGSGIARAFHSPTFGLAIPAGGPSFSVVVNYAL